MAGVLLGVLFLLIAFLCFFFARLGIRRDMKLKAEGKQTDDEKYGPKGVSSFPL